MASLETIGPLMNGMKKRPDVVGLACEAINRMFQKEQSELVAQVSDFQIQHCFMKANIPDTKVFTSQHSLVFLIEVWQKS